MSESEYKTGYRRPPRDTQFAKGQSGNPKGRPKGSRNLMTVLIKAGRQRMRIIENGRTRYVTKFEASMLQLVNKAVAGDLKAINELRYWVQLLPDAEQSESTQSDLHEADAAVLANIKRRILQSTDLSNGDDNDTKDIEKPESGKV